MADLGMILKPCLNIIDGLVGQSGQEWGGEGRTTDVLIAGDHVTATDACAAYLMGNHPNLDWPAPPFRRERNYILHAANKGSGTVDLDNINFNSEVKSPLGSFDSNQTDSDETILFWRKSASEQGIYYFAHRDELMEKYPNQYIFLQKGEVVWHGSDLSNIQSRRNLSGLHKNEALWLKYVDPEDMEQENFDIYEKELEQIQRMGL
jgi:hypothetical protein